MMMYMLVIIIVFVHIYDDFYIEYDVFLFIDDHMIFLGYFHL